MITLGVAGHIDHGKTSIIRALTGMDTDRLPEEKLRGMTTDLGFAWLDLDNGHTVGIVDVPGHRQYIRHVAAGLFACDAVLLVIAADDRWMPQTQEHLDIISLFGIKRGIIVVNKIDIVADRDSAVKDIKAHLQNTVLKDAPVICASVLTGEGIDDLRREIEKLDQSISERKDIGRPRLACDRVFSIHGVGVVVTGTLQHGILKTGEEIYFAPGLLRGRVRNIESFKKDNEHVEAGTRVGINISNVKKEDIRRGDVVTAEIPPVSRTIDAVLTVLPGQTIKNNCKYRINLETRDLEARIILFNYPENLLKRDSVLAQLRFEEDVTSHIGEKFIVRSDSPETTVGGGTVLDPTAVKYRKKNEPEIVSALLKRCTCGIKDIVESEVILKGEININSLPWTEYSFDDMRKCIEEISNNKEYRFIDGHLVSEKTVENNTEKLLTLIREKTDNIRNEVSVATLKQEISIPEYIFRECLTELKSRSLVERNMDAVKLSKAKNDLTEAQQKIADQIILFTKKHRQNPLTIKETVKNFPGKTDILRYLIKTGRLIELPDFIVLDEDYFNAMKRFVKDTLAEKGEITIQDFAARFGLSRKYNVPVLTKCDMLGITRRQGNVRVSADFIA